MYVLVYDRYLMYYTDEKGERVYTLKVRSAKRRKPRAGDVESESRETIGINRETDETSELNDA